MDPTYPLVPIANFLACIIVLLPYSRQTLRTWNLGVHFFVFWLVVQLIVVGVNAIVWRDNTNNVAPLWCDITSHVEMGLNLGGVGCTLSIARWLHNLTRLRTIIPEKTAYWSIAVDVILCIVLPIIAMALYYITQGARFSILEEYGCSVGMVPSFLMYLLISIAPLFLSLISLLFYTPRTLWTFYKQYKEVNDLLSTDNTPLDRPNYIRLFVLSALDVIVSLPLLIIITISIFTEYPISFWPGWSYVHQGIGQVELLSVEEWKHLGPWLSFQVRWNQWISPFWAIIFFLLFGTTKEARTRYRMMFWAAMRPFGLQRPAEKIAQEEQFVCFQPPVEYSAVNTGRFSQDSLDLRESQTLGMDVNSERWSLNNTETIILRIKEDDIESGSSHRQHSSEKHPPIHEDIERETNGPTPT